MQPSGVRSSARTVTSLPGQERAARQRSEQTQAALARMPELERIKARNAKGHAGKPPAEARASSTDPDATVMKMADGGFRPAYNVQFATDTQSQVIVGTPKDPTPEIEHLPAMRSILGEIPIMISCPLDTFLPRRPQAKDRRTFEAAISVSP